MYESTLCCYDNVVNKLKCFKTTILTIVIKHNLSIFFSLKFQTWNKNKAVLKGWLYQLELWSGTLKEIEGKIY